MSGELKDLLIKYDNEYQEKIDNGEIDPVANLKYLIEFIQYIEDTGFKLVLQKNNK